MRVAATFAAFLMLRQIVSLSHNDTCPYYHGKKLDFLRTNYYDYASLEDEDEVIAANSTVAEFFGAFRRLGVSWKHILRSYRRIIGLAGGGKDQKGDVVANNMEQALELLRNMSSDLKLVPAYESLAGRSRDDLLRVFLVWAATKGTWEKDHKCRGGVNGKHRVIKVTKAFRRLQAYAEWMKEGEEDLIDSSGSLMDLVPRREVYDAFATRATYDECGRVVWWMDLGQVDFKALRSFEHGELRRFLVWFAHVVMFNENAQQYGIVFVNNMSHISFMDFMTMLPLELGIKIDEFMICVVPLNTKLVLFLERPPWADFGFGILRVFLKKELRRRVLMVDHTKQQETIEDVLGGGEHIIAGFDGLKGVPGNDILKEYYNSLLS